IAAIEFRGLFGVNRRYPESPGCQSAGYHSPMPRYVAFLRAINVGGHTVSMARLVELFEALDFTGVRTFIASGNVLFNAAAKSALVERQLDRHLEAELGYRAEAFVRTVPELAGILANNPYPEADVASAHALMLGFLR